MYNRATMIIGFIIGLIALVVVASVSIPSGTLGKFERQRRSAVKMDIEVERELYHGDIVSLRHVLEALFLVITTVFSVALFGWLIGILVALLIALEYGAGARLSFIRTTTTGWYYKIEPKLFELIQKYPKVVRYIRIFTPESQEVQLHSREELQHIIETSTGVLIGDEKKLLLSAMTFQDVLVKEVMTPRSMIESISKTEILGPLVLHDLHKKGYSRFPVIDNDVDHIVGVLHLRDVLTLDSTKTQTARAELAMDKRVLYIHEDQTLKHALDAFIKTHQHLFIVVNEYRETVGLLTLEDTMETLLGREIVDEFDEHEDLRSVATRNPRANNTAHQGRDI
jgi:CBS domain containing-hemolysin-like protein